MNEMMVIFFLDDQHWLLVSIYITHNNIAIIAAAAQHGLAVGRKFGQDSGALESTLF